MDNAELIINGIKFNLKSCGDRVEVEPSDIEYLRYYKYSISTNKSINSLIEGINRISSSITELKNC